MLGWLFLVDDDLGVVAAGDEMLLQLNQATHPGGVVFELGHELEAVGPHLDLLVDAGGDHVVGGGDELSDRIARVGEVLTTALAVGVVEVVDDAEVAQLGEVGLDEAIHVLVEVGEFFDVEVYDFREGKLDSLQF